MAIILLPTQLRNALVSIVATKVSRLAMPSPELTARVPHATTSSMVSVMVRTRRTNLATTVPISSVLCAILNKSRSRMKKLTTISLKLLRLVKIIVVVAAAAAKPMLLQVLTLMLLLLVMNKEMSSSVIAAHSLLRKALMPSGVLIAVARSAKMKMAHLVTL